jgi:hypothetical protein
MKLSSYQILLLLFRLIFLLATMCTLQTFGLFFIITAGDSEYFLGQFRFLFPEITAVQIKILGGVVFLTLISVLYWFGTLVERKLHVHLFPKWHLRAFYQMRPRPNLLKLIARRQKQPK